MSFRTLLTMTRRSLSVLLLVMVIAGCGGSDDAKGPTATVGPDKTTESTTTTKPPTPEEEVEAAYLKSWDVYAKAKRELTTEGLDCCYAGKQLPKTTADIQDRIDTRRPARVSVDHDYQIRLLAEDVAEVRDSYRNHSVLVDPDSGKPIEPDPNDQFVDLTTLQRVDGQWKVTDIFRVSGPSPS
ncbi:MAG: hypothetical protein JWN67_870 [Actinomycetia bacterium]|nr:hypothetical protein [Actinomycetes bacterium]